MSINFSRIRNNTNYLRIAGILLTASVLISWAQAAPTIEEPEPLGLNFQSIEVRGTVAIGSDIVSPWNRALVLLKIQDQKNMLMNDLSAEMRIGNESDLIDLPEGWSLRTFVVPAGGCALRPVQFLRLNNGNYHISRTTASIYGPCVWSEGDYVFEVDVERDGYRGSVLGKLVIE